MCGAGEMAWGLQMCRAGEMAQGPQRLATKSDDPSLSPGTHVVEGESQLHWLFPVTCTLPLCGSVYVQHTPKLKQLNEMNTNSTKPI